MTTLKQRSARLCGFDIENTIFSGQCFRWEQTENNPTVTLGIIGSEMFIIDRSNPAEYTISSTRKFRDINSFNEFNRNYFSLDVDVNSLFPDDFRKRYPEVWDRIQPYTDIKILRQDPFETLITFMCAQGLGMHLIRKQVTYLAQEYGTKYTIRLNDVPYTYFSFPTPDTLASTSPESLRLCTNNNCIRAENIITAAQAVVSGTLDLQDLKDPDMPLENVRKTLCRQPGVGFKIADCVMLFGLHRFAAFPIDRHVHQYLAHWFSIGNPLQSLSQKHYLSLQEQAYRILKPELAGFAGHILFHCWRKEIKNLQSS